MLRQIAKTFNFIAMKPMKLAALAIVFTGTTCVSFAQEHEKKTPEQRAEKRTEMLNKKLDLSADQKTKVAEINQHAAKEVETIKNNSTLSKEDKKAQLKQLRETKKQELRSVLNSDQQQKFDKIKEKREHRYQEKNK